MSRDIPIIFSGPMVRALLERRKRMTRRMAMSLVKCHVCNGAGYADEAGCRPCNLKGHRERPSPWQKVKPGDRLWVRENFAVTEGGIIFDAAGGQMDVVEPEVIYAASYRDTPPKLTPCIHMPRIYSRITLVVTAVKIEPLWKISEADAEAEGCVAGKLDDGFGPRDFGGGFTIESSGTWASAAGMFQILWNSLHGEDAWDQAIEADTEVVALSFDVHLRNIDQMEKAA